MRVATEVEVKKDGRVILHGAAYTRMRIKLCMLADQHCENCKRYTPLEEGEAHHGKTRQMGGGRRDDRIFVDDKRQLFWLCKGGCHREKHVPKKVVPAKMSETDFERLLGL